MAGENTSGYFEAWDSSKFTESQRIHRVVNLVTRGMVRGDVLDLGCGSSVYYNVSDVKRWVGIDLSEALLDELRFVGDAVPAGPVEKRQGSVFDHTFSPGEFDTVCAMFILHHVGHTNRHHAERAVGEVMKAVRGVLKPDGTFVILETWPRILLVAYHLLYPLLYPLAKRFLSMELPFFLGPSRLRKLAAEAGFGECYPLAVDLYEDIRQPVLGIVLPAWLQPLFQTYTIYVIKP